MYAIRIIRNFYGPKTVKSYVTDNYSENGIKTEYRFRAEAESIVKMLNEETYFTAHNESSRPEYHIVRV